MAKGSVSRTVALSLLLGANVASASPSSSSSKSCSNTLAVSYPAPVAAKGWSYRLVANGFTKPRGIAFDNDGGLLVVDAGVGLVHLSFDDEGGNCLSVSQKKTLVADTELNHGLALSSDGKTVYVSSSEAVSSYAYDSNAVTIDSSSNHTVIANMSNTDHTTRTLLMSKKKPGTLIVSRGSESNEDTAALNLTSGHSQIRSFDLTKLGSKASYNFLDGTVLGWGLRNSVGVAEDGSGGIWSVENSVDQLTRNGKDVHENNPAEELNYHGSLGSNANQGGNYGYPLCYTLWSTKNFPDAGSLKIGQQFPDGNMSTTLTDSACNSQYVAPKIAFEPHTAPLDIKFSSDSSLAYVSFHGSWDSSNPVGYRIATVSFKKGQPSSAAKDSSKATTDILTNADLSKCPGSCFRPVGLAWDTKGRLWFSSDSTGEIFVMDHDGSSSSSSGGKLFPDRSVVMGMALATVFAGLMLA